MKLLLTTFFLFAFLPPSKAVTTKMFRVLDTCARYRLKEINSRQAIEKLKLESNDSSEIGLKNIVNSYCSVFTPNEKIEF